MPTSIASASTPGAGEGGDDAAPTDVQRPRSDPTHVEASPDGGLDPLPGAEAELAGGFSNLHWPTAGSKKRKRKQLSAGGKVDAVYNSVAALGLVKDLIRDVLSSTQQKDGSTPPPTEAEWALIRECMQTAAAELDVHTPAIAAACANSSAKKVADQAHRKVHKQKLKQIANQQLLQYGKTQETTEASLGITLKTTKEKLRLFAAPESVPASSENRIATHSAVSGENSGELLERASASEEGSIVVEPSPRKRATPSDPNLITVTAQKEMGVSVGLDVTYVTNAGVLRVDAINEDSIFAGTDLEAKMFLESINRTRIKTLLEMVAVVKDFAGPLTITARRSIQPPAPPEGHIMYSPAQAVNVIANEMGQYDGKAGISHVSAVKKQMIADNLVPVKKTALNDLVAKYVGSDKPSAPMVWGETGRRDIMTIDAMFEQFAEHQNRIGVIWTRAETHTALFDAMKATAVAASIDPSSVKPPVASTVESYYSALMSDPRVVERTAKHKTVDREVGDTSVRSMLSNLAGILLCSAVIGDENDIPKEFRFNPEGAGEGLLLSRRLVAEGLEVPTEKVHFLKSGLTTNVDDCACIYSEEGGFHLTKARGLVLKENVNGPMNRHYSVHTREPEAASKRFKGVKGRFTNLIADDGHMAPFWIQLPGLSEKELPPDKVPQGFIIMEVEGLTFDGNINPNSTEVGYVVWMRSGPGIEEAMFAEFEQIVRRQFTDNLRTRLGFDPTDVVPHYGRAVNYKDGGMTQLRATMSEEHFADLEARNETSSKLAKCTSTTTQPADQMDGHMNIRREFKKLSRQPDANMALQRSFDKAVQKLRDLGMLIIDAQQFNGYRGLVSRAPSAYRMAYDEKTCIEAFLRPGFRDRETRQGPDTLQIFRTLKTQWSTEDRAKWELDVPTLIREMNHFKHTPEGAFDRLGYPIDTDQDGNEYPLTANLYSEHHRQRSTIPNGRYLRDGLMAQAEKVKENARKSVEEEMLSRKSILMANDNAEALLHAKIGNSPDSHRSLFVDNPPTLVQLKSIFSYNLTPFVHARSLTSSDSKGAKIPKLVGNVADVEATLAKLQQNPGAPLDKKEDCLLLRAYQLRSVVDLPLKVEPVVDPFLDDDVEAAAGASSQQPAIVERASARFHLVQHSFMTNAELLGEARACFISNNFAASVPNSMVGLRDALTSKIPLRLAHFKSKRLNDERHLINHWTINAFEENIQPLAELAVCLKLVNKNVATATWGKSLLRPTCSCPYAKALSEATASLHGVALLHDVSRGVFVHSLKVDGKDNNFGAEHAKLLAESQSKTSTSKLHRSFPHGRRPGGYAKGAFADLEMLVGLAIDPTKSNDCLVRENDGLFVWSERTMKKLREHNSSSSDTLEQKQTKLVMCMFSLFLHLMLDADEDVSEGCFVETFMSTFNLAQT